MLSTSIIATTASSASLIKSFRFQISTLIRKVSGIQRQILPIYQTFPNLLCASFSTCRHPYPDGPIRCICLFLHESHRPSPVFQRLDTRCTVHAIFYPALREGQFSSRGCNVRFMLRPAELFAPLKWPLLLLRRSGTFTSKLSRILVALIRVGYSYLSEQTIPRTGLSPVGNAALWAARNT